MKKIEEKILSVIEKYSMISVGDNVVLAVSGGADSMCLLHFFNKYSRKLNINIVCAHINHGIRGAEADRDEAFVREFCNKNLIEFRVGHFNVPEIAKTTGESEETCGRRLRYEFFDSISKDAKIATAHNLNDSMETFLFNLARGTGLKGLIGIPFVRGRIIRPLNECTRAEIEEYLNEESVEFVTDSTNLSDEYSRNKIRHNVLPVFEEINPSFSSVFTGCLSSLRDSESFIEKTVCRVYADIEKNMKFPVCDILALDKIIRDRLIIKICENYGARDISFRHVEIINKFLIPGGAIALPGCFTVASDGKYVYKVADIPADVEICEPYVIGKTSYVFPGCRLSVVSVDKNEISNYNIKKLSFQGYADGDKIINAVFRSRKSGDRFRFPYAEHSKTLKNLYKEKNITPDMRYGVPMLADEANILWIHGVGVSDYAKVTEETENIIRIISLT